MSMFLFSWKKIFSVGGRWKWLYFSEQVNKNTIYRWLKFLIDINKFIFIKTKLIGSAKNVVYIFPNFKKKKQNEIKTVWLVELTKFCYKTVLY